ncbi:MAG: arginine--tRNA ligase [Egibacteraceae bacterium]
MPGAWLEETLATRVVEAARRAWGLSLRREEALIRPSAPGRAADYQSNVAMSLAKRLATPSPAVAAQLVAALEIDDVAESVSVAGPGFVNITLRRSWLEERIAAVAVDDRVGVPLAEERHRIVVDYSSPNLAKEMHVGHLRSTIIGDVLARLLAFQGHEVIRQNHLGDWGTPFGMLLEHTLDGQAGEGELRIADLNAYYQQARRRFDEDADFAERARRRVVLLQGGDPESLELWRRFVAESLRHFHEVYDLLGVLLADEDLCGESFYNPMLADVVGELRERGLAVQSDGAWCVFPEGFTGRDDQPVAQIVQKSDGGYTYDTTDLAALRYRVNELGANRVYYVVGSPQKLHLRMLFATARAAGWLSDKVEVRHVSFGSVLGEDGKVLRTRTGASTRLRDLLDEAVDRAAQLVEPREGIEDSGRAEIVRAVGIGAVKYADLSSDREKDYVFSWERMLAMDGNTAVYLQYAHARMRSIIAKAPGLPDRVGIRLDHDAERALAIKLLQFPGALATTAEHLEPHRLCQCLYETASAFSSFYEQCPVLTAGDDELVGSRLRLCAVTAAVVERGLDLLGIAAPHRI